MSIYNIRCIDNGFVFSYNIFTKLKSDLEACKVMNKTLSIPIYAQLEEAIKEKIKKREYLPGQELPTGILDYDKRH